MGLEDLVNKAKNAAGGVAGQAGGLADKAKQAMQSDKAEEISDSLLDKAADLANKVTGEKFSDQVQQARDAADKAIGNE
ncbi:antitoxin [Pseudoclavibacter sp. CFCC 13796]|uniref:antitoxin n=1 Tax=Pseudoclavibacter sp. CFCC 13796 TaxID=2615179 RepID=UPI001301041F|nr:antitoxin [Pseudoclavibacter sp. CFCC 13796]KAB1661016.1 antitoxin [Pseudoclavibacter sp. CFCC 13796]